jgi:hypothetical protein
METDAALFTSPEIFEKYTSLKKVSGPVIISSPHVWNKVALTLFVQKDDKFGRLF